MPLHVETGRSADPGQGVDEHAAGVPKVRKAQAAPPPGCRDHRRELLALIAGKRQAPTPQCFPYVRLCYKNEPFVSPAAPPGDADGTAAERAPENLRQAMTWGPGDGAEFFRHAMRQKPMKILDGVLVGAPGCSRFEYWRTTRTAGAPPPSMKLGAGQQAIWETRIFGGRNRDIAHTPILLLITDQE